MMFPTNPFPEFTSTIQVFPPSNSFMDHEKTDHHQCNNHNPFVSGDCFPANEEYSHLFRSEFKIEKQNKKDHHSKIHTSKGPRDRRVRLSIEVAKKFFYLQDLLGFDKASKTLDWLLNKSMISIDELIKIKKQSLSSTVTDRSEVFFLDTGNDVQDEAQNKKCGEGKRKNFARNYKSAGFNQSRTEARARARERTKVKLSKTVHVDRCSSNQTHHSSFWNSNESENYDFDDKIGGLVAESEDNISMLYGDQNNLDVSNDSNSKFTGFAKFADLQDQWGYCERTSEDPLNRGDPAGKRTRIKI